VRAACFAVSLLLGARGLPAQSDVAARLDGRVAPPVVGAVRALAESAAVRGLPVEPLIQKALEGGAKGVPADRVVAAVRTLAGTLDASAGALRSGGVERPGADVVEAGAYALSAGLSAKQVRDLARFSRPPYDPTPTLRVAGTLAALGVPPGPTLDLVRDMISAGRAPGDILGLPGEVQAGMARGATPSQAAAGVARARPGPPGRPPGWLPPGQAKKPKPNPKPNPHKP
jgi:hypothetical protein